MEQRAPANWPTTPERLLEELLDGRNSKAWSQFEKLYGAILHRFCLRRGLQHADAEDIVQRVLLDVSRQIGRFQIAPERGRFRSWLATISNRAVWRLRERRAAKGEISLEELSEQEQPADDGWMIDFNAAVLDGGLARIREEFTSEEWIAFERRWIGKTPSADIAAELNREISWVYQAKCKVLSRLKEEIGILSADIISPNS